MRRILALLFLSISLLAAHAAGAPELQALATEPAITGFNCNPYGGPTNYAARVYIENTYDGPMIVNYTYFDYFSGAQLDGGRACTLGPKSVAHCEISIPVRLGGSGSGTSEMPIILYATVNGMNETLSKQLNFTVRHTATSTEADVSAMIEGAQDRITGQRVVVESACAAGVCCGMTEAEDELSSAYLLLMTARSHVSSCSFSDATQASTLASNALRQASASYNRDLPACNSALTAFSRAKANLSGANATLYSRAACNIIVNESRAALSNAAALLSLSASLITNGSYPDASTAADSAVQGAAHALSLSGECPQAGLNTPPEIGPTLAPTPAPPQSDTLSKVVGALGYVVIAAIIVVIGAAVYITLGKGRLEGGREEYPRPPPEEPPAPRGDHSKIDREFQEWLKQAEKTEAKEVEKGKPKRK